MSKTVISENSETPSSSDLYELRKIAKELGVSKYYTLRKDLLVKEIRKKEKKPMVFERCIHKVEKRKCEHCYKKGICKHGRKLSTCKECKGVAGNNICMHDKYKYVCKECKGSQVCEHNKQRISCKLCKREKYEFLHNKIISADGGLANYDDVMEAFDNFGKDL